MAVALSAVVLLPLLITGVSYGQGQDMNALLLKVIGAIDKLIGFYRASYRNMNLDGIFGLKVLEGQLQRILDEHGNGSHAHLDPQILQRLSNMLHDTKGVAESAMAAVRADDEQYFQNLGFIITKPWSHLKPHRRVVPALRWEIPLYQTNANLQFDEATSDKCMMEITAQNKSGTSSNGCSLSKECGLIMTKKGLTDYGVTHQILWSALAEKSGCGEKLNALLKELSFTSADEMQEEFCTNNYYEMLAVVQVFMSGHVRDVYQDMFMEQHQLHLCAEFVCPSLGFYEFLKKDYLDQILSWQLPSGCFGSDLENEDYEGGPEAPEAMKAPQLGLNTISDGDLKGKNLSRITGLDSGKQQQQQQQAGDLQPNSHHLQPLAGSQDQLDQLHLRLQEFDRESNPFPHSDPDVPPKIASQPVWKVNPEAVAKAIALNRDANLLPRAGKGGLIDAPVNHIPAQLPDGGQQAMADSRLHFQHHGAAQVNDTNKQMLFKPPGSHVISGHVKIHAGKSLKPLGQIFGGAAGRSQHVGHAWAKPVLPPSSGLQNSRNVNQAVPLAQAGDQVMAMRSTSRPGQGRVMEERRVGQMPPLVPANGGVFQGRRMLSIAGTYNPAAVRSRNILSEKEMPGGCYAHKTGVACGALVMYLRYLIDPGPLNLFAPHDFFPDGARGLLGDEISSKKAMSWLGQKLQKRFHKELGKDPGTDGTAGGSQPGLENREREAGAPEEGAQDDEDEEEGEEDEDEYEDREELYPDAAGGEEGQQPPLHERKVVHFGAGNFLDQKEAAKNEYVDEKEEEEDEGADYIKRVKGDDQVGNNNNNIDDIGNKEDEDKEEEDTEYTYYDDNENTERGIIRKHKPPPAPQNGPRIRSHSRHKPHPHDHSSMAVSQQDSPPTKMVVLLLSATSIVLVIFMYRFIRKRRIHLRYHNRSFVKM